jgi:hypothetical protein
MPLRQQRRPIAAQRAAPSSSTGCRRSSRLWFASATRQRSPATPRCTPHRLLVREQAAVRALHLGGHRVELALGLRRHIAGHGGSPTNVQLPEGLVVVQQRNEPLRTAAPRRALAGAALPTGLRRAGVSGQRGSTGWARRGATIFKRPAYALRRVSRWKVRYACGVCHCSLNRADKRAPVSQHFAQPQPCRRRPNSTRSPPARNAARSSASCSVSTIAGARGGCQKAPARRRAAMPCQRAGRAETAVERSARRTPAGRPRWCVS